MTNPVERGLEVFCRSQMCENVKLVISTAVVFLLVLVVFVGISLTYCVLKLFPLVNFVILLVCTVLLAYVEALHYACVAVEKWDMKLYAAEYPRALKCHALVDTPEKVKKFLVGRQFFVIFVVFFIAQVTTFEDIPKNFAGLPEVMVLILIQTGLPGVAFTLNIGQLISQIYIEEFTIQLLNLPGTEFVIRLSLFAEYIGICNFSWLLYGIVSRLFCSKIRRVQKEMDSARRNEMSVEPMSPHTANRGPDFDTGLHSKQPLTWFDYLKYLWSTVVTLGSVVIVIYGIHTKAYVLPVPPAVGGVMVLVLLVVLYYLEGLMIAIVATQYWDPETFREVYPRAFSVHALMSEPENVKRFIIGRQFFTVLTNFLLAQLLVFAHWSSDGYEPVLFYIIVKSGLVGVLIILAFAQLLPELLAAEFPLRFMNMYGTYTVCYLCLFFDTLGVGHAAWSIYYVTRRCCFGAHLESERHLSEASSPMKPAIVRTASAEVLAKTGKHNRGDLSPQNFQQQASPQQQMGLAQPKRVPPLIPAPEALAVPDPQPDAEAPGLMIDVTRSDADEHDSAV